MTTLPTGFRSINRGYDRVFRAGELSIGLVVPITRYDQGPIPSMVDGTRRVQLAESLGFTSVWLRDVPFVVPSFGDAGQLYDPFVYLGFLAGQTSEIALGVASIVLPLRHPAHVAKAAASVDELSGGRLILGVASGDRPTEYPAMNLPFEERGEHFREAFEYIRQMSRPSPSFENAYGSPRGIDLLPKPTGDRIPMLITGTSRQTPDWAARHGDGWMTYPRTPTVQRHAIDDWRSRVKATGEPDKPVLQPLYVDLLPDPDAGPQPLHLGFRAGARFLRDYVSTMRDAGVNHLALNLRMQSGDIDVALHRLAETLL